MSSKLRVETATARAAEAALRDSLTAEVNRAKQVEGSLRSDLDAEEEARTAADQELRTALNTERGLRIKGDNDEKAAREAADDILRNRIANEERTRSNQVNKLRTDLDAEVEAREAAVSDLDTRVTRLNSNLTSEIVRAKKAEQDEYERAKAIEDNLEERVSTIESDYLTSEDKSQLASRIDQEIIDRGIADTTLQTNINIEKQRAEGKEGELLTAINKEVQDRTQADNTLQRNIDDEAIVARAAELDLSTNKADWGTTLADYHISDAYTIDQTNRLLGEKADKANTYTKEEVYTKEETESAIDNKLQSTFKYKGSKAYYSELPVEGNKVGDVWNILNADPEHGIEAGDNVCWSGSDWDKFGGELAVDSVIDFNSTNPVQNKVIAAALQNTTAAPADWGKTTAGVGGLPAGTDLSNKSVLDILNDILYPYIAISGAYANTSPSTGTYLEKGATVTISKVSGGCSKGSKAESSITLKLFEGSTELASGTGTLISYDLYGATYKEDTLPTYKLTATDGKTNLSADAAKYTWLYKSYYGAVEGSVTTPTEEQIKGLASSLYQKSSTRSISFSMAGQKAVYAYPKTYGILSKIEDSNGFNVTSSFDRQEVSIENQYNETAVYYVYTLVSGTTADMTYTFKF